MHPRPLPARCAPSFTILISISQGIEDGASNHTRFLLISREPFDGNGSKTSIIFATAHEGRTSVQRFASICRSADQSDAHRFHAPAFRSGELQFFPRFRRRHPGPACGRGDERPGRDGHSHQVSGQLPGGYDPGRVMADPGPPAQGCFALKKHAMFSSRTPLAGRLGLLIIPVDNITSIFYTIAVRKAERISGNLSHIPTSYSAYPNGLIPLPEPRVSMSARCIRISACIVCG